LWTVEWRICPSLTETDVPTLSISNDKRVGCVGRTGVGKTFLIGKLLNHQPRVIVVDLKERVRFPGYHLTDDARAALINAKTIYRPKDGVIPDWWWVTAMDTLHEAGGGIIYIDEASEVTTPGNAPKGLKTVFRLGREIGVGVWWSAQEATAINNVLLRQSDVLLLMLNIGASDRDKLINTTGDMGEATKDLGFYEFMVFQSSGKAYDASSIPVYKYDLGSESAAA
jgi:hypothetical protein